MGRRTTVQMAWVLVVLGAGCVGLQYATAGRDAGGDVAVIDAAVDAVVDVVNDTAPDTAPDVAADSAVDQPRDIALDAPADGVGDVAPGDAADAADVRDAGDVLDVMDALDVVDVVDAADGADVMDVVDARDGGDVGATDGDSAATRADAMDVNCAPAVNCGGTCAPYCVITSGAVTQQSCMARDARGCGLVAIGGGTFTMGGDSMAMGGVLSLDGLTVLPLYVDRYEVTVDRFRRFWAAVGGRASGPSGTVNYPGSVGDVSVSYTTGAGYEPTANSATQTLCNWTPTPLAGTAQREDRPLNCVSWATAMAFCVWDGLGGNTGRLPTEAEWEWIARGSAPDGALRSGRSFPWGEDAPMCARAHYAACSPAGTNVVDAVMATYGLFHLVGNVAEWTADVYAPLTDARCWGPNQRNPLCLMPSMASLNRSIRGGFFMSDPNNIRGAARASGMATDEPFGVGFRCVRSL